MTTARPEKAPHRASSAAGVGHRKRLTLALLWLFATSTAQAEDEAVAPPASPAAAPAAQDTSAAEEARFLAFLEYLGSWEESDEEWQAFHPDEGLSEISLPDARDPNGRRQAEGDEEQWDDNGRS